MESARHVAASAAGILVAVLLYSAAGAIHGGSVAPRGPLAGPPTADVIDAANPDVLHAQLDATLTQWGLQQAYSGSGPPGVLLQVQTPGTVLNWTVEAWANQTTPPPTRICSLDGVHFNAYDWTFQSRDGASGTAGSFTSLPSTVPQRLGPDGDQCQFRAAATGTWHVTVLVEGKRSGPLGLYRDQSGTVHADAWDARIEKDVRVGA